MRKKYVDYIKAIGIILVVLGHINFANSIMKAWLYAFHMPLFFFATGLTIKSEPISKEYVIKKIKVLIVPYMIWGLIYSGYSLKNLLRIGYGSYHMLSKAQSLTSLWFLNTMFVALILVQLVLKLKKSSLIILAAICMFGFSAFGTKPDVGYPWCFDIACMAAVFILIGYLFEKRTKKIDASGKWVIGAALGAGLSMVYRINLIDRDLRYVLMANGRIGNPYLFFVSAIGGCLLIYGLAKTMEYMLKCKKIENIFSYIGTHTIEIFVLHKPIIEIFENFFEKTSCHWLIQLTVTGVGTLSIAVGMGFLLNYFSPCLFGKNMKKYKKE